MRRSLIGLLAGLCAGALGVSGAVACEVTDQVKSAAEARDFERAERLAHAVVGVSPDEPDAHLQLAQVYALWAKHLGETRTPPVDVDANRAAQALRTLDEVIARWPGLPRPRVCALDLELLLRDDDAFTARLERLLEAFPARDPELMGALGVLLHTALTREQEHVAIRACELLAPRDDLTASTLSNCGFAELRHEDFAQAHALYGRAHAIDPSDALVVTNTALVEMILGDLEAAQGTLETLAKLDPDDLSADLNLAVVRTVRTPEQAPAIWKRLRERCSQRSDTYAKQLLAFSESTIALAEDPGGLDAGDLMGMARDLMSGGGTTASVLLRAGERMAPKDPAFPFVLAQAFDETGYPRLAFDALRRAQANARPAASVLEIPPASIDFETGRVALGLGRAMDAVLYLERARRAERALPNVEYLLGRGYAAIGDRRAAEREYTACLERRHNTPEYQAWCRRNREALSQLTPPAAPSEAFDSALAKAGAPLTDEYLSPRLVRAVQACVAALAEGGSSSRLLLLRVAADGTVAEVLQLRKDGEPLCFASQLRGARLSAAPGKDRWLRYDIDIRE